MQNIHAQVAPAVSLNDLLSFCSTDSEQQQFNEPFTTGRYTYATDAAIVIRVDRIDAAHEKLLLPSSIRESLISLAENEKNLTWIALPEAWPFGIRIGNNDFSSVYLNKLSVLKNVFVDSNPTHFRDRLCIKFDGGFGLLAPLRRDTDHAQHYAL
ncbi:MAG: hypothetical protein V4501_08200 [Pseudomonadota bacterium]